MPVFTLNTNVAQAKISTDFVNTLSAAVAKALGKPESYVVVHVVGGQTLSFGGSTAPAASAVLKSIGGLGTSKQNNAIAAILYPIVEQAIGVPADRMYIEFVNLAASAVAFEGQTFG